MSCCQFLLRSSLTHNVQYSAVTQHNKASFKSISSNQIQGRTCVWRPVMRFAVRCRCPIGKTCNWQPQGPSSTSGARQVWGKSRHRMRRGPPQLHHWGLQWNADLEWSQPQCVHSLNNPSSGSVNSKCGYPQDFQSKGCCWHKTQKPQATDWNKITALLTTVQQLSVWSTDDCTF